MSVASGIDPDELEPGIRPQDDLFRHVNGRWIDRTEIPSDKARYGSFYLLAEEAEKAVRDIIIESQSADPGTEARKVGDLYASFMDEARIQALGAEPIAEALASAAEVSSIPDVLATLGRLERGGASGFFAAFVDNDPGQPDRYLVFLEQSGLGLPDESYYREDGFADIRTEYVHFIERMLTLVDLDGEGDDSAAARASRIMTLETELATHHWDNVTSRDSEKTYNPMLWQKANDLAGSVDLDVWLTALGVPERSFDEVVVRQPSFLSGLESVLRDDNLAALRDWLAWQVVRSNAPYLSKEFVETNFGFYGRTLTGTPQIRDRWKRGVSLVEGALGEAVGRIYVERHFPEAAKTTMDGLVANLVEAYRQSIEKLEWMGPATRARALEKLAKFTPKIGYPVRWRDYSSLEIDATDLIGNIRATNEFEFQRELGKIGKPLDRDEWFMTPQTINAYYNPGFNEIVFPAAILQFPFFDETRDAAANYGAIGAVIGHEIGHGFDDQGSKYDGDGKLTDWWTPEDRAAFEERTASLIEQYNALAPLQVPDHHVNGALTIGENIGDLGGLSIAWKAYLLSLGGQEPPVIDGFTGAQRFFLSWAQAWQLKARDEEVVRLLTIDPHSPSEFRCNQIVRNIDEFYDAFDVSESDALWLDPKDRVTIW
ncbi:putative endopeptidase [Microbacteriaceae bacterium SG_E_30_P1]|uniref:Endopeptidase n=1 Tax=Antiquaquibacter oligotrophicus TaxID=2880260 RepID=A0ABT6KQZ6_9MICO|nr:M13-type metalloendopeptidase [Antiquaquibacter oligotrophicus]MDH6182269.1 putative endopeptidase [Antiquaquibacter oligotrophicus]UDF12074.1 peptidase M13 [Antiquaquibacter oligotrophicus]